MELFSVNRVRSFRSIREEGVWDLIKFIASSEGRSINLSDKIYTMTSSESSATTIEWAMSELLRNLRVMEKAQSENVLKVRLQREQFRVAPIRCRYRICPGISFATSNIELGLAQLLCRFNWELTNDTKSEVLDTAENLGITERRNNLHVIATSHIPFHK
ncbi:hypothetical protein CerSpe_072630 [Prunus speciosa]